MMPAFYEDWIDLYEDHVLNELIAGDPILDGSWASAPSGDIHSQIDPEAYAWQQAFARRNLEITSREFGLNRKPYPF